MVAESEEAVMRGVLLLSIALLCTALAQPGNAVVKSGAQEIGVGRAMAQNAQKCPPGSWWIREGYQRKGKWKPGHCSKVTTRSS
jgi:hypothetical protein